MNATTTMRRTAAVTLAVAAASLTLAAAQTSATTLPADDAAAGGAPAGDCDWVDPAAVADLGVHDAAAELEELSTFAAAVAASSLDDQLAGEGPFTIFAPSNAAMSEIPTNVLDSMLADPDLLDSILSFHVVVGESLSAEDLAAARSVDTPNGSLTLALDGDILTVNGGESNRHVLGHRHRQRHRARHRPRPPAGRRHGWWLPRWQQRPGQQHADVQRARLQHAGFQRSLLTGPRPRTSTGRGRQRVLLPLFGHQ